MPTISRFYGVLIRMYFADHAPPHFHAEYGEYEAVFGISPVSVLEGYLPVRARSLVVEWAALHQDELLADWELCQAGQVPNPIAPLE